MNGWVRDSKAWKSLFAIAVVLALSLRILIPAGFMPAAPSTGMVVELCAEAGGGTVVVDLGKRNSDDKGHAPDSQCIFSAGLGQALLTTAEWPIILPPIYGLTVSVGTTIADLAVSRLAAPPPPSQGPPALR